MPKSYPNPSSAWHRCYQKSYQSHGFGASHHGTAPVRDAKNMVNVSKSCTSAWNNDVQHVEPTPTRSMFGHPFTMAPPPKEYPSKCRADFSNSCLRYEGRVCAVLAKFGASSSFQLSSPKCSARWDFFCKMRAQFCF